MPPRSITNLGVPVTVILLFKLTEIEIISPALYRPSLILIEFINKNRIGLSLSHTSNANLGDKNPGVEVLSVSYQFPVK